MTQWDFCKEVLNIPQVLKNGNRMSRVTTSAPPVGFLSFCILGPFLFQLPPIQRSFLCLFLNWSHRQISMELLKTVYNNIGEGFICPCWQICVQRTHFLYEQKTPIKSYKSENWEYSQLLRRRTTLFLVCTKLREWIEGYTFTSRRLYLRVRLYIKWFFV